MLQVQSNSIKCEVFFQIAFSLMTVWAQYYLGLYQNHTIGTGAHKSQLDLNFLFRYNFQCVSSITLTSAASPSCPLMAITGTGTLSSNTLYQKQKKYSNICVQMLHLENIITVPMHVSFIYASYSYFRIINCQLLQDDKTNTETRLDLPYDIGESTWDGPKKNNKLNVSNFAVAVIFLHSAFRNTGDWKCSKLITKCNSDIIRVWFEMHYDASA